jgi:hypothetical protein
LWQDIDRIAPELKKINLIVEYIESETLTSPANPATIRLQANPARYQAMVVRV